jgi:Na+-transporting methylmalonyl-CoA/oxaloacetate decarboxylase gamma subunit
MHFNYENFITALEVMGKGMGSIFAVILLLTFIVMLLAKFTGKKKPDKDNED